MEFELPIAYASRQMNTAERRYATSESEMLSLVWANKYFCCYQYGNKFQDRTALSALTYLHILHTRKAVYYSGASNYSNQTSQVSNPSIINRPHGRAQSQCRRNQARSCHEKEFLVRDQEIDACCMKKTPGTLIASVRFFWTPTASCIGDVKRRTSVVRSRNPDT